jgi:hypothetical protein
MNEFQIELVLPVILGFFQIVRKCVKAKMKFVTASRFVILFLLVVFLAGCRNAGSTSSGIRTIAVTPTASPASDSSLFLTQYVFPTSIEPTNRYMFYLHGKIIEDQGIPAVSPEYGTYEYEAILEKLASFGFTVISEQRPKNSDLWTGRRIVERRCPSRKHHRSWRVARRGHCHGNLSPP